MDFITGFPKVQGKDGIFVVVDHLTTFAHFFAISIEYSASQVAKFFFKEVLKLHEFPKNIVSDTDSKFVHEHFLALVIQSCWHQIDS